MYRLKIVEWDGTYSYTPVRMIRFGKQGEQSLIFYPNPATQQVIIVPGSRGGQIQDELVNAAGQVLSGGALLSGTANHIDVSTLVSGTYLLKINTDGDVKVYRLQIIH
ncbi:MAG: T9SS type A sorting domain-containing protein [Chitinophagaceae bacterium]|nr:T9SS type A sorting domain-containing protein [Chitinophagaceae bacterium]